jgi:hypothetical protein
LALGESNYTILSKKRSDELSIIISSSGHHPYSSWYPRLEAKRNIIAIGVQLKY